MYVEKKILFYLIHILYECIEKQAHISLSLTWSLRNFFMMNEWIN